MLSVKNYLTPAMLLFLSGWCTAAEASNPELIAEITETSRGYRLTFVNVSERTLHLPNVYLSDAHRSGYWLFLYEPGSKKLIQGFASVLLIPGKELPLMAVAPGSKVEKEFEKDDLLGYFMYVPKCYYLVVLYRWPGHPEAGFSKASKPLYQCGEEMWESLIDGL
jgi:hypothetical protein